MKGKRLREDERKTEGRREFSSDNGERKHDYGAGDLTTLRLKLNLTQQNVQNHTGCDKRGACYRVNSCK